MEFKYEFGRMAFIKMLSLVPQLDEEELLKTVDRITESYYRNINKMFQFSGSKNVDPIITTTVELKDGIVKQLVVTFKLDETYFGNFRAQLSGFYKLDVTADKTMLYTGV